MPDFWIYILFCENNTYYTGYAKDVIRRYHAHVQGTGAKYTRSFKPVRMAQVWPIYGEKRQAMQIEHFIKTMTRHKKEQLIEDPLRLSILML